VQAEEGVQHDEDDDDGDGGGGGTYQAYGRMIMGLNWCRSAVPCNPWIQAWF